VDTHSKLPPSPPWFHRSGVISPGSRCATW
jgi:hypothetical protein